MYPQERVRIFFFFFQAEDGIRDLTVTGVQTCPLPISHKVVEAVLGGEADVGIISYPPTNRALSIVPLPAEPMAFVCHPNHPLGRHRLGRAPGLNGGTVVALDPGLTIRKGVQRRLRARTV